MRKISFDPGEHYHLCARGVGRRPIFLEDRDFARFLFLLLYFQGKASFANIGRQVSYFLSHGRFHVQKDISENILTTRVVMPEGFAIMPNHFHVFAEALSEGGVSLYMQRVLNGYGKYFNTKYKRTGHVFESAFRAVHIENDNQLMYLSAYIHRNPVEITGWRKKEKEYPWSSFQDYISENRWGDFLNPEAVLSNFQDAASYEEFVDESGAKNKIPLMVSDESLFFSRP